MFNLASPEVWPEQLVRSSMGQVANIGDLYDATTDRFTGQSVLTAGSPKAPVVNATRMESFRDDISIDNTFYDKLNTLLDKKELGLKLSAVVGLTVAEENIGVFVDRESPATGGLFVRTFTNLHEKVDNMTDIERLLMSCDFTDGRATHVVVGIDWGATVAVSLDRIDTDVSYDPSVNDDLQQHLQMLVSVPTSGARRLNSRVRHINSTYYIRCFSNCLPQDDHSQVHGASLEDATLFISNLSQLIHSVNNGKGAPVRYIFMPLSSLNAGVSWTPCCGIADSVATEILSFLHDLTLNHHDLDSLAQYLAGYQSYVHEDELAKVDEFLVGLQHAVKTLHDDIASVVVAVRSGDLDQLQIVDVVRAFSSGNYSTENIRAFYDSMQPIIQKTEFCDELIHEGIVIIGNAQTDLSDITRGPNVYILYATEAAKQRHMRLWQDNSCAFLDIVRQEKKKHAKAPGNSATAFAYIDCDVVSGATIAEEIAIYRYKNGQVICTDVAEDCAVIASMNIAESSREKQLYHVRPPRRAVVEIPCPGISNCGSGQRTWSCEVCREQIEYGFDEFFYCSCGKAPLNTFSYKCNGHTHGDDFVMHQSHQVVREHLRNMKPIRELNILFLGETGVGKSTWINGFANYISYSTLSEAERNDSVCLIPTKFPMTNENFEDVEVKTGEDKNEDQRDGRSSTQMPKSYVFRRGRTTVRIIDTPGIGDTRGIDQDRINLQNIMTHLSNLDEINGICVLLKPNNARLTVMFSFCIKELLTHLHRNACKNIVFCFTNARGTFYKPGDTLPALRQLLATNTDIDLRLCKETIYCIDNESVRFLAALKQGIKFDEEEKKNYAISWEASVKETNRLIEYISSLPPHKIKNTLSLNDARRLIVALSRPLAEITSTIQNNIAVVEQRRREVLESTKHKDDLSNNLYIPAIDLKTSPLNHPRTVCTSSSCVKHIAIAGVQKIDYVKHCHPHCYLTGVPTDIVNCTALQQCAAMGGKQNCQMCGCSWKVHMHITYECTQVKTNIVDVNIQKQIQDKTVNIETINQHLKSLEDRIRVLEDEKRQVAEVSAKFGCFLKHNAIAPFNDAMLDYLEHLIEIERGKVSAGGEKSTLTGLENMKSMYEEEVKILERAINDPESTTRVPVTENIRSLYDHLCHLQITGPMLKNAMNAAEAANVGAMQYNEQRIRTYRRPPRPVYQTQRVNQPRRGWGDNPIGRLVQYVWR